MSPRSIIRRAAPAIVCLLALACRQAGAEGAAAPAASPADKEESMKNFTKPTAAELETKLTPMQFEVTQPEATVPDSGKREIALLAGGCFWGVEELLRKLPGVVDVEAGYTGGTTQHPDY